MPEGGVAANS